MKQYLFVAVMATFFLYACSRKEEKHEHALPVAYHIKNFAKYSSNCQGDSLQCASFEVSYPEFSGIDTAISLMIKFKIDSAVSAGYSEGLVQTLEQTGNIFIEEYENFIQADSEAIGMGGWYHTTDVTVNIAGDSLVSLTVNTDDYSGGAHPNAAVTFININPRTGKTATLSDFLKPGYQAALTKLGEAIFRRERELADTASFKNNFFDFPDDKFKLNQNYGFTKEGIQFFYNSYEVAPYAAGPTDVVIPYSEIKDWLK
ncbi:DUF3298 and DUF4163 domain-containing protein [Ohtaekwangia sp.]|uniref:DUF3298 and DUF4163 domain-containing protein n=1 Tax=Ohtaekwangia sp. TaxID=2066019 RepID=UPI002FDD9426